MDKFDPRVRMFIKDLEETIESKRNALERQATTEIKTAFLRGEIKALRSVIADMTGDPEDNDSDS
jgi:hypothetical protein